MKHLRSAIGASAGGVGLYTTIVTMIVESYAIYAVAYLVYIILFATRNSLQDVFATFLASSQVCAVSAFSLSRTLSDLGEMQIIAPFLIVLRVAERRALTKDTIISSGNLGSIRFRSQGESRGPNATVSDGSPTTSLGTAEQAPEGHGDEDEDVH